MRRVLVCLLLLCGVTGAFAEGNWNPNRHPPCKPFVENFCKDVPMGEGRRLKCLNAHRPALTPACRKSLDAMLALYEFGKKQQAATQKLLAKEAEEEKAEAAKKSAPASPPKGTPPGK